MGELTRESTSRTAVQRYVIAWAERERAQQELARATASLRREETAARESLRIAGEPLLVKLLDGQEFDVFADAAGVVVVPRAAG